jgi:hypothetical protein
LLELSEVREVIEPFDEQGLVYPWWHPDLRVDQLCEELQQLIGSGEKLNRSRRQIFSRIWQAAYAAAGRSERPAPPEPALLARAAIAYLNEPWYC